MTSGPADLGGRDPTARGSALLFWAQLAGNSGLFVALVLVTRALGPSGRGTIAFITVAAILLARLARLGVSEAATVFAAQRPAARPAILTNLILWVGASTVVGACLVCGTLALLPAAVRPNGIGAEELVLLGLGALASAFADAGYTFVLGCSRFRLHAMTTGVTAWLYVLLVAAIWASVGLTVASAALAWIAVQGAKGVLLLSISARDSGLSRPDAPSSASRSASASVLGSGRSPTLLTTDSTRSSPRSSPRRRCWGSTPWR